MKKLIALLGAVLLCLGLSVPVYAQEALESAILWLPVGGVDSVYSEFSYNEERNSLSFSYWDSGDEYRYCCVNLDDMTRSEFDWIHPYAEGRAAVMKYDLSGRRRWGFLDEDGQLAVPLDYDQVFDFSGGSAIVGSRIGDTMRYGLIGPDGQIIAPQKYLNLSEVGENLLEASVDYNDQRWSSGLMDRSGRMILPADYSSINTIGEGLLAIWEWGGEEPDNVKAGLADSSGKILIPMIYNTMYSFSHGVAIAGLADDNGVVKYGLIGRDGQILASIEYDFLNAASGGLFIAGTGEDYETRKYGVIDSNGKVAVPLVYDQIYSFFEGLAATSLDGKWGYIDPQGEIVVPLEYDYAESFSDGSAVVGKQDGGSLRYGTIDCQGNVVIPLQYDYLEGNYNGFHGTTVRAGEDLWRYGLVTNTGETVIPPEYDLLLRPDAGLVSVMKRDDSGRERWGLLDTAGKEVLPLEYDDAFVANGEGDASEALVFVRLGGSLGIIELPDHPLPSRKTASSSLEAGEKEEPSFPPEEESLPSSDAVEEPAGPSVEGEKTMNPAFSFGLIPIAASVILVSIIAVAVVVVLRRKK